MNKTVVFLFLLISFSVFCRSKNDKIYALDKYEVVNPHLYPALDSIIKMKDSMPCYKSTGLFTMEFDLDTILTDLIFVNAEGNNLVFHHSDMLGYFNYQGHSFVISGDSIVPSIFEKTGKYRNFVFGSRPTEYTKEGEPILNIYRCLAVWSMRYKDGQFKILSFFTHNKKDDWFDNIEEEYNSPYRTFEILRKADN